MGRRSLVVVAMAAGCLAAGCLKEGRPVVGRQLLAGRSVEKPAFVEVDGAAWVTYQVHQRSAVAPLAATYDLDMIAYDTAEVRALVRNVSERWDRAQTGDVTLCMADETTVAGPGGGLTNVATLVRLAFGQGVLERIPNVSSFTRLHPRAREIFYQVVREGMRLPELRHRSEGGVDRLLGFSSGGAQFADAGRVYFVAGDDLTLSRIVKEDGPVESIRNKVTRFLVSNDQRWVALRTTDAGARTVVRQLDGDVERVVPGQNLIWISFPGPFLRFSESVAAGGEAVAKIHTYDPFTEKDTVTLAPPGLLDVVSMRRRPGPSGDLVYADSRGHVVVAKTGGAAEGNFIGGSPTATPLSVWFPDDGRDAVYIETVADPTEGRLMVQDLEFAGPPRLLSPPGSLVPRGGFFPIHDIVDAEILVFWSHFGHNATDLYYANRATGDLRVVAEGISEIWPFPYRVIGIVRVSGQDLVGDLVNTDLALDREIELGHEVADAAVYGDKVAFVLRGRIGSERDGLWAIGIDGVPPDAGVAGVPPQ